MRKRVLLALGTVILMAVAFARLSHAFGLFSTQMVATQAAVAHTDSAESNVFSLNTMSIAHVGDWESYGE